MKLCETVETERHKKAVR